MEKVRLRGIEIGISDGSRPGKQDRPDAVLCPSFAVPPVDLAHEIDGQHGLIALLALQSEHLPGIWFTGLKTQYKGSYRMSAVVCSGGRVRAIADRTLNLRGDHCGSGSELNVFRTHAGRLGLLVDTDVISYGLWKKAAAHCDVILAVCDELTDEEKQAAAFMSQAVAKPFAAACPDGFFWGDVP